MGSALGAAKLEKKMSNQISAISIIPGYATEFFAQRDAETMRREGFEVCTGENIGSFCNYAWRVGGRPSENMNAKNCRMPIIGVNGR